MLRCDFILEFLSYFLGSVMSHPSLSLVLPRMIRGMIKSGSSSFADSARSNSDEKIPRSEIKNYHNLCKSERLSIRSLQGSLLDLLVAHARDVKIAVDWTDMGEFRMLVFAVIIGRRTIPVFWWTIRWHDNWVKAERAAFKAFRDMMPVGVAYIVLADRGFGNPDLVRFCSHQLGMHLVFRAKRDIYIRRAEMSEFVLLSRVSCPGGKAQDFGWVEWTKSNTLNRIRVVRIHDEKQKEPWVLLTTLDAPAKTIVRLYGCRFLIEETSRMAKTSSTALVLGHAPWTALTVLRDYLESGRSPTYI